MHKSIVRPKKGWLFASYTKASRENSKAWNFHEVPWNFSELP